MALTVTEIQQLYTAYLGRPVDQEGVDYWTDAELDLTIADLRFNLANDDQPEYVELYGDRTREELVTAIYDNMFGRVAEEADLDYWVNGEGAAVPANELQQLFIEAASDEDSAAFEAKVQADLEAYEAGDTSELTEALETYQAAVAAKSDFLKEAAEVEAVADEFAGIGADPSDLSEAEIEEAIGEAVDTAQDALHAENTSKYAYDLSSNAAPSDAALAQMITDIQADLAKELQDARDEIADSDISGLQTALNALVSAQGRYVSAVDEEEEADLDAQGELAKVIARNAPTLDNADFLVADGDFSDLAEDDVVATTDGAVAAGDGSNVLIAVGANGQLVAGDGADGVDGFAALLSSAQAYVDANVLLEGREESLVEAANRVVDTESGTDGTGTFAVAADVLDADNDIDTTVFNADAPLAEDFLAAMQNENAFASALEEYQAVKQLADTLEGLNDDLEAAGEAIEELGYELSEEVGTEANDLFVFTGDEVEIDLFGEVGDDLLFIGTDYTLGADVEAGDDSVLEIFFTQKGDDTVVTIEEEAFGSSASTPEVVEITLAGVNAEDLQFENGYVSVVEVA